MPHSIFTGRIVREGEPQWTQDDTDMALALLELEAEKCPGCGHSKVDTFDPENEFGFVAEAVRCHACATRDREAAKGGMDTSGLHWITRFRDGWKQMRGGDHG